MTKASRYWTAPAVAVLVATTTLPGGAQAQSGVYAYPLQGQSQQQQQKDQLDCHNWAVSQTGFDPVNTPRPAPATQSYAGSPSSGGGGTGFLGVGGDKNLLGGQGSTLSDAGTGAAFGAIGGAIAGNAGMGAAIGAGSAALFGAISRSSRQSEEDQWRREQNAQAQRDAAAADQRYQDQMRGYRGAYGSCMSARQYRVQQ